MSLSRKASRSDFSVGCVIPCYRGGDVTLDVISRALPYVDHLVLVDDSCPLDTGILSLEKFSNHSSFKVLFNDRNRGVGYSTIKGFKYLLLAKCDILVKIDADDQIKPELIPNLIDSLILNGADAIKGNRFTSIDHFKAMPPLRIFGNLILSFLNKLSTGYWELFDPTNGFIAFKSSALARLRLEKVQHRYFFESDLLFQSSLSDIFFIQFPMESVYQNEQSSLVPFREAFFFLLFHLSNFIKRVFYQYFLLDFNIGSLELLGLGLVSIVLIGVSLFVYYKGRFLYVFATPGEAGLIAILSVTWLQLVLSVLFYDSTQKPMMRRFKQGH